MGLLDALAGRSPLLRFEVLLTDDAVCARVLPLAHGIGGEECLRLWAAYQAWIVYGFGGADTERGAASLEIIDDLLQEPLHSHTDVFAQTWLGDSYRYSQTLAQPTWQITGTLFARRTSQRRLSASMPWCGELQKHASALGVFQLAIHANSGRALELLARTAASLLDIYRSQPGNTVSAAMEIPDSAWEFAAGRQ